MNLTPHLNKLRGVFVGSGSDGMSDPRIANAILNLSKKQSKSNILYIGTATYDLPQFKQKQVQRFVDKGCSISSLNVAFDVDKDARTKIKQADVPCYSSGRRKYIVCGR